MMANDLRTRPTSEPVQVHDPVAAPRGGHDSSPFIWMAMFLALVTVVVGAFLTATGGAGDTEISALGIHVRTRASGVALIALGLVFYVRIGRIWKGSD